jgi:GTP-binding protein HflX
MAHPFHDNQIEVVNKTLSEIGVAEVPTILVLNKIDLVEQENATFDMEERKRYYRELGFEHIVFLSASTKQNLQEFRDTLGKLVMEKFMKIYPNYMPATYES